jgi:hypothetical protein
MEHLGNRSKIPYQVSLVQGETVLRKTDPYKERTVVWVCRMLVGLADIPMMLKDKAGDSCYYAWPVWARN